MGIRVFPLGGFNGVDNGEDQEAAGLYLIRELAKRNLAYLHLSEPDWAGGNRCVTSSARRAEVGWFDALHRRSQAVADDLNWACFYAGVNRGCSCRLMNPRLASNA